MKLFTIISSLLIASSSVSALPVLEERQSSGTIVTNGGGSVRPRLEIRQMKDTQPNQYAILVVALARWQKASQTDISGYFGISSIHGVPRDNYNGVNSCGQACANTDGYGVHDMVLFPMWHRIYLATFEQEFLKVARTVASEYPASQRATMVAAANAMRWPYYDSAARPAQGRTAFPKIVSDYSVTVNGPTGKVTMDNPFFRYNIADPSGFVYYPFQQRSRTYRYPSDNGNNPSSNTQACINAFTNTRQSFADQFYALFTNCHDWLHFSNDDAGSSSSSCPNSVEIIHNSIHNAIGGQPGQQVVAGHMTYLPLSSFDPSFWLHHANIDRIIAMWQRLNPDAFGDQQQAPHSTWTIAQGTTVGPTSPLTPFLKPNNAGFWTPNDVRDWTSLGYTYPEFANSDGSAASIRRYVNNLYGPNANAVAGSSKRDMLSNIVDTVGSIVNDTAGVLKDGNPLVASNGSLFEYQANLFTPRYALNGSYNVFLFKDGPGSTDTTTWITDSNLIGMVGVLSMPGMTADATVLSAGIPLTRTLQEVIAKEASLDSAQKTLQDLTEDSVSPYLTQHLQWLIAGPNGESIDPGTVPGFVVSVYSSSATRPASDDDFPVFSEFVNLLDVTKDQSGGANSTQQALTPPTVSEVLDQIQSAVSSLL